MRRSILIAGAGLSAVLMAVPAAGEATGQPPTTLDKTIVAEGEKDLGFGPGENFVTRTMEWKDKKGKGRPLAGFKHVSDLHVIDEESPARVEFFDMCDPSLSSAYRVQEAMSAQVGESMLRRLSKLTEGPATGRSLDFTISTGDNIDNNQTNELRWFIDLLDGKTITPDSGAPGYDGYTQEEFSGALTDELLEAAQESFDATGAGGPWYAVLGNHDGLIQGNVKRSLAFHVVATSNKKIFYNLETYECPADPTDTDALTDAFTDAYLNDSREVPADDNRRFLEKSELIEEFFDTSGKPKGHGLNLAPEDPLAAEPDQRAGYYAFDISDRVVGISMDTISYDGGPNGQLDNAQFQWIEETLKKYSRSYYDADGVKRKNPTGKNKLVVLFSHHTSLTLNNPRVPDEPPAGMLPVHCFAPGDAEGCADGEGLGSLLQRYPNVVAWVNGHEHNNRVTPQPYEGDPARGYWEINTAAHIDWPQQSRLLEIAWKPGMDGRADTVFIYGTVVDHQASPDPKLADPIEYLASLSRIESYYDACVRENQATCEATGTPGDRNVKLVQKAPFNLGN